MKKVKEYTMNRSHIRKPDSDENKIPQNFNQSVPNVNFAKWSIKKYNKTNFNTKDSGQTDLEEYIMNNIRNEKLLKRLKNSISECTTRKEYNKTKRAIKLLEDKINNDKFILSENEVRLEETVFRLASDIISLILPKYAYSMYSADHQKNKEFVKMLTTDLKNSLNDVFKDYGLDYKLL